MRQDSISRSNKRLNLDIAKYTSDSFGTAVIVIILKCKV